MRARTKDLNSVPYWEHTNRKKQVPKNPMLFHFRGKLKIVGKENDVRECTKCHRFLTLMAFGANNLRSDGAYYLTHACRECRAAIRTEQRRVRKNALPEPEKCDCCHKNVKLQTDHVHGTNTLRGWLCRNCNNGIGKLGDTLEGVLRSAFFLEPDTEKIIGALNKIKNEME